MNGLHRSAMFEWKSISFNAKLAKIRGEQLRQKHGLDKDPLLLCPFSYVACTTLVLVVRHFEGF